MDSRVTSLYNEYVHGDMPRRVFFRRVTEMVGSVTAATALVALLEPDWASAQQVQPDDAGLITETITYAGTSGPVSAYLARPAKASISLPGVLVIHENRGLNAHIQDVARRMALAGYVALAPDGLSYVGGGLTDQEAARDRFRNADRDIITKDVIAGVPYLAAREDCSGRIGTVGFCYGGGVSLQCAVQQKAVAAAACFYGRALPEEDVAQVTVPLMMHYAGADTRVNSGIPAFRSALDKHEIAYSLHMYPGSGHGFHNDTSRGRYDAAAANLAWKRTLGFFEDYLGNG